MTSDNWFYSGQMLDKSGKTEEAIEAYSEAIRLNPYYADAYYERGYAYYKNGIYYAALRDYYKETNTAKSTPDSTSYYQNALHDLNRAIELNPKSAKYFRARASINRSMGYTSQSERDNHNALITDRNV